MAWAFEKHANYSARSAYRMLSDEKVQLEDANRNKVASSNATYCTCQSMWKQVWKLGVPPKDKGLRVVYWCLLHDFIPTKEMLHQRHVDDRADCFLGGARNETAYHALLECPRALQCWEEIKIATNVKVPRLHPLTWASYILIHDRCTREQAAIIIYASWAI